MIDPKTIIKELNKNNLYYLAGVPDSILSGLISYLNSSKHRCTHRIAANEGSAISLGMGYYLSTKKVPVIYFQNSGISHASNPLASMADKKIFGIPMILLIGRRGAPDIIDEPQHYRIGPKTIDILKSINISSTILTKKNFKNAIYEAKRKSLKFLQPQALIIEKNFISKFKSLNIIHKKNKNFLIRMKFIDSIVLNSKKNDFFISTTGNTSRELYVANEKHNKGHSKSFYCIGAMGHANQVALEVACQSPKKRIFVLDGDGAVLMHMGNLATVGNYGSKNLIHIVFKNGIHESTGGHFTTSQSVFFDQIFKGCGYQKVYSINKVSSMNNILKKKSLGPTGIVINIKPGTIENLPRPTKKPKELINIFKI